MVTFSLTCCRYLLYNCHCRSSSWVCSWRPTTSNLHRFHLCGSNGVSNVFLVKPDRINILTGKPTLKRPLGRPRSIWVDNIRMDISTRNWVDSAQDKDYWRAFLNAALNHRIPQAMELVSWLV